MASFELRVERSDLMKPLLTSRLFSAASDRIVLIVPPGRSDIDSRLRSNTQS